MATATKTAAKGNSGSGSKSASSQAKRTVGKSSDKNGKKMDDYSEESRDSGSRYGSDERSDNSSGSQGDVSVSQFEKELGAGFDFGRFFGEMFAFNNSLKLYHWHVNGPGSYAEHMALDQAIASLAPILDRLVETTYSLEGDVDIVIPQTQTPTDIAGHCQDFYDYIDEQSDMFEEEFSESILEDYQETIQQLLYRLRRLR